MKMKAVILSQQLAPEMFCLLIPHMWGTKLGEREISYVLVEDFIAGHPFCTLFLGKENPLKVDVQTHGIAGVLEGRDFQTFGFGGARNAIAPVPITDRQSGNPPEDE